MEGRKRGEFGRDRKRKTEGAREEGWEGRRLGGKEVRREGREGEMDTAKEKVKVPRWKSKREREKGRKGEKVRRGMKAGWKWKWKWKGNGSGK